MARSLIMEIPSLDQIQTFINQQDSAALECVNIAVLRNIVIEPLENYLRFLGLQCGWSLNMRFGGYDLIWQNAVNGAGLMTSHTHFVFIFNYLEHLSPMLSLSFAECRNGEKEAEFERIRSYIDQVLHGIRTQTEATILWHCFELPVYPEMGLSDSQNESGQIEIVCELNKMLKSALRKNGNAYYVDMTECQRRLGIEAFYDPRLWHLSKAPYSNKALKAIALQDFKFLRAFKGKNKKCLVLDCDNTLWGGIFGEDGLSGIKLSNSYPGNIYVAFQRKILSLFHRGVILTLCSKNNADDVWQVFSDHPDMVLRKEHFAAARINWNDKAANIRELAEELNIGLESMVFVDDSPFEIERVRLALPEVLTVQVPKSGPLPVANLLFEDGWFDSLEISEEDRNRGAMYRAESDRRTLRTCMTSMENYLRSLKMVADLRLADDFSIPRIAQLTQRTNQFNMTTQRYSSPDIHKYCEDDLHDVITLRVSDRFGDLGIVGTCILVYNERVASIDTFLLSCRAFGRKAEDLLFHQALRMAKERGCHRIEGEYKATPKNNLVCNFYSERGFTSLGEDVQDGGTLFGLDLTTCLPEPPDCYQQVDWIEQKSFPAL